MVVEAYAQLVAEGWLIGRHGSGTVVAETGAAAGVASASSPAAAAVGPPLRWSFRPGTPDLSRFSRGEWLAATRRVLRDIPDAALGYPDAAGPEPARRAVAAYLGRVRGVIADPGQVILTSGMAQGLILTATVLRRAEPPSARSRTPAIRALARR